jgi:hypothetical protein
MGSDWTDDSLNPFEEGHVLAQPRDQAFGKVAMAINKTRHHDAESVTNHLGVLVALADVIPLADVDDLSVLESDSTICHGADLG